MNDIIILKWFGLLILLGIAAAITLVLPFHILFVAICILILGVVGRWRTTPAEKGARGGSLMVFGALMMLPPLAWITSALVNMNRR